ncbi:MAG: Bug family tripartite tricarboxylate transporter substrate binding protein, partial [Burkholderiales bacterium]
MTTATVMARQRAEAIPERPRVSVWQGIFAILIGLLITAPLSHAQSSKWPDRPVRVIVPLAPGGGTDIVARLFAARFTAQFGQQFIVDNRSGAGGTIGAEIAARANPDGYTLVTVPA